MATTQAFSRIIALSLCLAATGACNKPKGGGDRTPNPTAADTATNAATEGQDPDILVTVNGVPIREADLHYVLAAEDRGRGRGADAEVSKETLEQIIELEIARQQAEALGLDRDPEHVRKLHFMQAPVNDFRRTSLSESYLKKEVVDATKVSGAEARAYYDEHRADLQTEYHVMQIMMKNDALKIRRLRQQIAEGLSFEAAAATLYEPETLKVNPAPWDLGFFPWHQLPVPWQEALATMKDGDISDVIVGPSKRAWIVKLVASRRDAAATFEALEPIITEKLRSAAIEARTEALAKELRAKANITYLREAGAMPPAPDPED